MFEVDWQQIQHVLRRAGLRRTLGTEQPHSHPVQSLHSENGIDPSQARPHKPAIILEAFDRARLVVVFSRSNGPHAVAHLRMYSKCHLKHIRVGVTSCHFFTFVLVCPPRTAVAAHCPIPVSALVRLCHLSDPIRSDPTRSDPIRSVQTFDFVPEVVTGRCDAVFPFEIFVVRSGASSPGFDFGLGSSFLLSLIFRNKVDIAALLVTAQPKTDGLPLPLWPAIPQAPSRPIRLLIKCFLDLAT